MTMRIGQRQQDRTLNVHRGTGHAVSQIAEPEQRASATIRRQNFNAPRNPYHDAGAASQAPGEEQPAGADGASWVARGNGRELAKAG